MDAVRGLWPILVFLIAFYALATLMNLAVMWPSMRKGFTPFRKPDTKRPRYAFDPTTSAKFRGGQRVGWLRASWPFATLTIDTNWVSVEGSLRDVWIDRSNVVVVRPIGGLTSKGMFFESADGAYDGVIFQAPNAAAWQALRSFGWPVAPHAPASRTTTNSPAPWT